VPEITHFVAGLGTSGTLMGVGRFLKEQNPDIQIVAVEPPARRARRGPAQHRRGLHPAGVRELGGFDLLDRKRIVRPRESIEWTRRLVGECGIFAGISSGAALPAPRRSPARSSDGTIVFIVCDGGWKYLSTGAYTDDLDEVAEKAEKIIYF
jgi:[CysO sulfur-carrier protein]-thiocarboxylate-dependent cysteine synthase